MKIKDVISVIEDIAPRATQEAFDNSGLQVGNAYEEATGALLCVDITENVIDEAIALKYNLIIAHHPLIFKGLKSIVGNNYVERCVHKAIKHDIALYAAHTNLDNSIQGINFCLAHRLGLENVQVLVPKADMLYKIEIMVPREHAEQVSKAAFKSGAGHIGNYDECAFCYDGFGSFRALDGANPFVGKLGTRHTEPESRVDMIVPNYQLSVVLNSVKKAHPYEEPAINIIPLQNANNYCGLGAVGELPQEISEQDFLQMVKTKLNLNTIRHSPLLNKNVRKVALCGGSGAEFLRYAKAENAHFFLTGDIKYHSFFEADNEIVIADIGHFESESVAKDIFYQQITKKIPNFAVRLSQSETNIVSYF